MRLPIFFLSRPPISLSFEFLSLFFVISALVIVAPNSNATELEVTSFIGYNFSPDLLSGDGLNDSSVNSGTNYSLAFAWQEAARKQRIYPGQGQVLINYSSRDFVSNTDKQLHDFDILYTHFNGVTFMNEKNYVTTVGLGFGAAYFDGENDSAIYPSITSAIGTRHVLSSNLFLVTEVRVYVTLVEDDANLFCQQGTCFANFNESIWFDSNISVGFSYSF